MLFATLSNLMLLMIDSPMRYEGLIYFDIFSKFSLDELSFYECDDTRSNFFVDF
jgi:hypothetical protein